MVGGGLGLSSSQNASMLTSANMLGASKSNRVSFQLTDNFNMDYSHFGSKTTSPRPDKKSTKVSKKKR